MSFPITFLEAATSLKNYSIEFEMKHWPVMLLKIKDKSTNAECRMHLVPPIPAINGIFGSLVTFYTQLTLK